MNTMPFSPRMRRLASIHNPLAWEPPFPSTSHRIAADHLRKALQQTDISSSSSSPQSSTSPSTISPLRSMLRHISSSAKFSVPWYAMAIQFVWTSVITIAAFYEVRTYLPSSSANPTDSSQTKESYDSFSNDFWERTMFNVPSSLSFGVGWALFLLLSFFVREASKHRLDGRLAFAKLSFTLRRAARHLRQNYGKDDKHPTWHHGDHDRIIAHLVAYPLAFIFSPFSSTSLSDNDDKIDNDELQSRMKSKATNDELLHLLLHHDDVRDIYDAPMPYLKCMSVVRSYFTATEPDNPAFAGIHATETPAGMTTRNVSSILLDEIDATATSLQRIKGFRPAVSYVNHLTLFVYIWLGFMPLTLLSSAGWLTPIWSLPVTYAVAMLFKIAHWLNDPFGKPGEPDYVFDALCLDVAYNVLLEATSSDNDTIPTHLSAMKHDATTHYTSSDQSNTFQLHGPSLQHSSTPAPAFSSPPESAGDTWLHRPLDLPSASSDSSPRVSDLSDLPASWQQPHASPTATATSPRLSVFKVFGHFCRTVFHATKNRLRSAYSRHELFTTTILMLWTGLVMAGYTLFPEGSIMGWWFLYLPIQSASLGYVSSVLSVMFGFWLQDAYGRYRRSLELLTVDILPQLRAYAYQFPVVLPPGSLHPGDTERFLSHVAALPVTLQSYSSHSALLDQVDGLLHNRDALALKAAQDPTAHVLSVIASYIDRADATFTNSADAFNHTFGACIHLMQLFRPRFEQAVVELQALKRYNIVHPLRSHLVVVTWLFLLMLPVSSAVNNGLVSLVVVIPSIHCVLHLITVGFQLDHPFGTGSDDIPMDDLTNEMKRAVHDSYTVNVLQPQQQQQRKQTSAVSSFDSVNDDDDTEKLSLEYDRRHFTPKHKDMVRPMDQSERMSPPWKVFAVKILSKLPKVNMFIFAIALTWNIFAVLASYGLSVLLPKDDVDCRAWCSVIDIEWSVLWNVGRVLFTILSFRAADAIGRYDDGKRTLGTVCTNVTAMAMDIVHSFPSGRFHQGDKERLIAHLIQIPLYLRDKLLADHRHHRHHHRNRQNASQHGDNTSSAPDTPFSSPGTSQQSYGNDTMSRTTSGRNGQSHHQGGAMYNNNTNTKRLLSRTDEHSLRHALDPLEASINVIESYFLRIHENAREAVVTVDRTIPGNEMKGATVASESTYVIIPRMYELRKQVAKLMSMKRYPFVRGYRFHQQLFIALWLVILPFSMTSDTGFVTIITATLKCYAILALETSISDLVDPFGRSHSSNIFGGLLNHDIPVAQMCETAAADIIDGVESTKWDIHGRVHPPSGKCPEPKLGTVISNDGDITTLHDLPTLEESKLLCDQNMDDFCLEKMHINRRAMVGNEFDVVVHDKYQPLSSSSPALSSMSAATSSSAWSSNSMDSGGDEVSRSADMLRRAINDKHRKLSYAMYSLPWGLVQTVTIWTALACFMSFLFRDKTKDGTVRWWTTPLAMSSKNSSLLSFITFTLLAFYVNESYERYACAARVWYGDLQWLLHTLTAEFRIYWDNNSIHDDDQKRLIGHLAALPYALRSDLRHSRNLSEARGLLSTDDYAEMSFAKNMSVHALSVIRAYYTKVAIRGDTMEHDRAPVKQGRLNLMFRIDFPVIENVIQTALHYRDSDIAPQFTLLLNVWLAIWFVFLPFILVEFSGWLTIGWVPAIAISILGMRAIAREIVHPYGNDLNDLDLDTLAHDHAADVISTYRTARLPSQTPYIPKPKHASDSSSSTSISSAGNSNPSLDDKSKLVSMITDHPSKDILVTEVICPYTKRIDPSVARRRLGIRQIKVALKAISKFEFVAVMLWSLFVMGITYMASRFIPLPSGNDYCSPWFCSVIAAQEDAMEFVGFGLFLILNFRMADSHARYSNAVRILNDDLVGTAYLLLNRFYLTFQPGLIHPGDLPRVAAHVQAFAINVLGDLRCEIIQKKALASTRNLRKTDIAHMLHAEKVTDTTVDVIRGYLLEAERLPKERKMFSGNDLTRIFIHLRKLSRAYPACVSIKRVQIPRGYLIHLRMFILMWAVILPFALVQLTGWTTVIWTVVISYTVIAIEHWASELSDPFGCDMSDIALEQHVMEVMDMVRAHKEWAGRIIEMSHITGGRAAFPTPSQVTVSPIQGRGGVDMV